MGKTAILILAASFLTGCATVTDYWHRSGWLPGSNKPKQAAADPASAPKSLKKSSTGKAAASANDQIMFRKALLALKPNRETIVSKRGRQLLDRLKKEYPSSPWTAQAVQIDELIVIADELSRQNKEITRQNKELKAANESLTREVEELTHNIEQMKHLDIELEKAR